MEVTPIPQSAFQLCGLCCGTQTPMQKKLRDKNLIVRLTATACVARDLTSREVNLPVTVREEPI